MSSPTVTRFFTLHYTLAFILAAFAAVHLIALHDSGSGNPLGLTSNSDRLPMHPYFLLKDGVTVVALLFITALLIAFIPNALGDSDNYIPANNMSTPLSILVLFIPYFLLFLKPLSTRLSFYSLFIVKKYHTYNSSTPKEIFNTHEKPSDLGIVIIDNKKVYMSLYTLKEHITDYKERVKIVPLDTKTKNLFKCVCNGVFQAEGHIGGSFISATSLSFRPI